MINFSFIVGFRNRDYQRVRNSLDSLNKQTIGNFEVIFVNYGSDEQITFEIEHLLKNYPFCRYIYTETRGLVWSRANALNAGLKLAIGKYVIFSDIDLLFPANFTELSTPFLSDRTFLTHRCYYLAENHKIESLSYNEFRNAPSAYVGLLAVKRENALKINGFDEFYQIWGVEDDDFIARLERAGLRRRVIDVNDIPVWHQWHPTASPEKPIPWYLAELNYLYFNKSPSLESTDYGKVLTIDDRPALRAYLDGSYKSGLELRIAKNTHLAYLDFYKGFSDLKSGQMCFLKYENEELLYDKGKMKGFVNLINRILDRIRIFHYRFYREEKIQLSKKLTYIDVRDFIEYFLSINRCYIKDCYYYHSDQRLILLIQKA